MSEKRFWLPFIYLFFSFAAPWDLFSVEGIKKRSGSKEFQEKQKLLHKLKREKKGAKRELRRDTEFLARQRLTEDLEKFVFLFRFHQICWELYKRKTNRGEGERIKIGCDPKLCLGVGCGGIASCGERKLDAEDAVCV